MLSGFLWLLLAVFGVYAGMIGLIYGQPLQERGMRHLSVNLGLPFSARGLAGELGAPLALAEACDTESLLRGWAAAVLTRRAYVATLRLQSLLSQPTGSAGRPLHDPVLAQQNSLGGPLTQQTLESFRLSTGPRGAWVSLARTGCRRQLHLLGLSCYGPDPEAQHLPAWGASASCAGHTAGSRFSEDGAGGPKKAAFPTPLCPVYVDH
ncbi:unnamed protein product, partial [Symbiodinium sp. CCMP2456]